MLNVDSVCDGDGEFLLIEAADYLPNWLNPDTAENRVSCILSFLLHCITCKLRQTLATSSAVIFIVVSHNHTSCCTNQN